MILVENEHRIIRVSTDKGAPPEDKGETWVQITHVKLEQNISKADVKITRLRLDDALKLSEFIESVREGLGNG